MKVRFIPGILAIAFVFCLASAASAQQTATETLVAGQRAISFQPLDEDGSTTVGLWRVRDASTRFGWLVSGHVEYSGIEEDSLEASVSRLTLGVGPEIRRYRAHAGRIAPFTFLGAQLSASILHNNRAVGPSDTDWSAALSGRAGFGAEFFPVRNFGLDAQVGLNADLNYRPLEDGNDDSIGHQWGVSLSTFAASLGGSFYF